MAWNPLSGTPPGDAILTPDFVYKNNYSVGTTEKRVFEWEFLKDKKKDLDLKVIKFWLRLKSSDGIATATAKLYVNGSSNFDPITDNVIGTPTPDATVATTSGTYQTFKLKLKSVIKALPDGLHTLTLSLVCDTAGQTADTDFQQFRPHHDD